MSSFGFDSTGVDVVDHFSDRVRGKVVVITGASANGLGAATATSLAHGDPAQIILLGRSAAKVNPVIEQIKETSPNVDTIFVPVELDKLDSVREAASTISSKVPKVHYLINNAGIMAVKDYTTNSAGIESQFATNHLGHFLLTNLLMDQILAAGPNARIVNLTSDGHLIAPCRFEDYNFKDGAEYEMWAGYGQSKTANILFTVELARRLKDRQVQSVAVHPGVIFETSLSNHLGEKEFKQITVAAMKHTGHAFEVGKPKSLQQGVSTTLVAALDPSIAEQTGSYMNDCSVEETREYATSTENAQRLWKISEDLVGEKFDF